ncbi:MAG: hypothetical protein J3R72DRAFT_440532 [Linnemannia gamsii]|nr:MAG: hypothetical protein J3R72DRAFT_440532 [Linnemannia gamsii]
MAQAKVLLWNEWFCRLWLHLAIFIYFSVLHMHTHTRPQAFPPSFNVMAGTWQHRSHPFLACLLCLTSRVRLTFKADTEVIDTHLVS